MSADTSYADALAEIHALRSRLAGIEAAAGISPAPVTYSPAQLEDREFFKRNEQDILLAAREPGTPRIVEAEPIERPAPVYPPSEIEGWKTIGQDMYEASMPAPKKGHR
jgi:hypothetical protein